MVRVGTTPAVARAAWHDRNPTVQHKVYAAEGIGPHTETDRWSYTVPSMKKALVELLQVDVYRDTVATTAGIARSRVFYQPSGAGENKLLASVIFSNNYGDKDSHAIGATMTLLVGDMLKARTWDTSTGGTCGYFIVAKITEFDA